MATLEKNAQGGDKHTITIFYHSQSSQHKSISKEAYTSTIHPSNVLYCTVLYLLVIQESIAGTTTIQYRTVQNIYHSKDYI